MLVIGILLSVYLCAIADDSYESWDSGISCPTCPYDDDISEGQQPDEPTPWIDNDINPNYETEMG